VANKTLTPKATTRNDSVGASDPPATASKPKARPAHIPKKESGASVQGEGDYESARRYRSAVKRYVETADVERAAHDAAPKNTQEAEELEAAEQAGQARAKLAKPKQ
jgi:hypothetical protein